MTARALRQATIDNFAAANQNIAIERAIATLRGSRCESAQQATMILIAAFQARSPGRRAKPRTLRVIDAACTIGELLMPVDRRRLGRDRILETIDAELRGGGSVRLSIGRSPKDDESVAREVGRRLAILIRAREIVEQWRRDRLTALTATTEAGADIGDMTRRINAIEDAFAAFCGLDRLQEWHARPDGRRVLSWRADILQDAIRDVVAVRRVTRAAE